MLRRLSKRQYARCTFREASGKLQHPGRLDQSRQDAETQLHGPPFDESLVQSMHGAYSNDPMDQQQ